MSGSAFERLARKTTTGLKTIGVCSWPLAALESDAQICRETMGIPAGLPLHRLAVAFRGPQLDRHSGLSLEATAGGILNLPMSTGAADYDLLVVGHSCWLYTSLWYAAFVLRACELVRPGGFLAFAKRTDAGPNTASGVPLRWLCDLAGSAPADEDARFFYFRVPTTATARTRRRSIFDWYRERGPVFLASLARGHPGQLRKFADLGLKAGPGGPEADPHLVYEEPAVIDADKPKPLSPDYFSKLENAGEGSAYKVAYITWLLAPLIRRYGAIDVLDHGSGPGLVPVELLLEHSVGLRSATAVEPSKWYVEFLADAYRYLGRELSGDFYYEQSNVETYTYPRKLHAISFCGCLLFVARSDLRAVLSRAWDALHPGGLLIVLEGIRSDSPRKDLYADKMFTIDELEDQLGHFGEIERYHPQLWRRCTPAEADACRIFRVLRKPA